MQRFSVHGIRVVHDLRLHTRLHQLQTVFVRKFEIGIIGRIIVIQFQNQFVVGKRLPIRFRLLFIQFKVCVSLYGGAHVGIQKRRKRLRIGKRIFVRFCFEIMLHFIIHGHIGDLVYVQRLQFLFLLRRNTAAVIRNRHLCHVRHRSDVVVFRRKAIRRTACIRIFNITGTYKLPRDIVLQKIHKGTVIHHGAFIGFRNKQPGGLEIDDADFISVILPNPVFVLYRPIVYLFSADAEYRLRIQFAVLLHIIRRRDKNSERDFVVCRTQIRIIFCGHPDSVTKAVSVFRIGYPH